MSEGLDAGCSASVEKIPNSWLHPVDRRELLGVGHALDNCPHSFKPTTQVAGDIAAKTKAPDGESMHLTGVGHH